MEYVTKDAAQQFIGDLIAMAKSGDCEWSAEELAEWIVGLDNAMQIQKYKEKKKRRKEERKRQRQEQREAEERQKAHVQEVTSMELPLDWENFYATDSRTEGVHADSIADGLILSLSNLGRVDIEYISAITGADYKTIICTLKGSIYQNPMTWGECFFQGWETAEAYLSGNLKRKWQEAKAANDAYDGYFAENLRAIEAVLPPALTNRDIYITLGSPWVPPDVIDAFIREVFGDWMGGWVHYTSLEIFQTKHDALTGSWEIPFKARYPRGNVRVTSTYGTSRLNALHILERTLNMKTVSVTDEVRQNGSGKRTINQAETILALEKQQEQIRAFQSWVWKDPRRKARLEAIFEEKFTCVRRRHFDGAFLQLPGLSPDITLYPYQKNAVARIIFTPNTLLAHEVGSGKTYIMIAAGMELRRMGLSRKNLYVVPNHIVGQWEQMFHALYPDADVLAIGPRQFVPQKREAVLETIRDGDFDAVIMAFSCFEQIPLSRDFYLSKLQQEKEQLSNRLLHPDKATSRLKKKQEKVHHALEALLAAMDELYDRVYFDELRITRLFVDEAHHFKNVPITTQIQKVLGINTKGSKKCSDMMDKVSQVQQAGGGVIFATGTPITNSITDAYIMQKYLQSGELALLELQSFDSWIGMFAEQQTAFEIDVDTSGYRLVTRFSQFHNLPELTTMLASIADFHQMDVNHELPQTDGRHDALIGKTTELSHYLSDISRRADEVRSGLVNMTEDNMLKITTDGRKAALDIRLVKPSAPFTNQSKVARCAENVAAIYTRTAAQKATQLVFCDISTPKAGFHIYGELKRLLLQMGVAEEEIAFVHDAENEAQRSRLFARVRSGKIRILLGSTSKLGTGVNVQDRLIALHHLDVPWRPADMTQREGRILRQGNLNKTVQIFRYITEGSFDAYSWQLLETKQRFINELLAGSLEDRSGSDVEDTVLNYAEVKALAVGNPLVKQRVETANELTRTLTLQKKSQESRMRLEQELAVLPVKLERQRALIAGCAEDMTFYAQWQVNNPPPDSTAGKQEAARRRRQLRDQLYSALQQHVLAEKPWKLFTYCGFDVVLPANMMQEKPWLRLERNGRYVVELGDTDVGNLIRLDNFLEDLPKHHQKLCRNLEELETRQKQIREALARNENLSERLAQLTEQLAELDKKLGVNQK